MSVIDTNVLVYDTFEDTSRHAEARALLDSLPEWRVPTVVFVEFAAFLNRSGLQRRQVLEKLREFVSDPRFRLVSVELEDVLASLELVERERLSTLRINDKLILSVARRLGVPLLTFDRRLERQAKRVVERKG